MHTNKQTYTPVQAKLLADSPSESDQFGGAYSQMAAGLAKLLQTSEGGKCIRLDGVWGSGKSTIIKLLTSELKPNDGFVVFQYDAWVHAGDPLRRAFLESLIQKLGESNKLKYPPNDDSKSSSPIGAWKHRLDILAGKIKSLKDTYSTAFSPSARNCVAFLLALTASLPFLNRSIPAIENSLGSFPVALLVFAIVMIGGLLISPKLLSLIIQIGGDIKQTKTISDGPITSLEFQGAFDELLLSCLANHSNVEKGKSETKLVIVIDNLDRVEVEEARAIWTLLRSFLDNPSFTEKPWYSNLWVIIPMGHIANTAKKTLAESDVFLEKAFQVRLRMPPPMLHSWQSYFREKLKEAFGECATHEHDDILRIYELYRNSDSPPLDAKNRVSIAVRPREIVSFINDLVAIWTEWSRCADVSFPLLAAYCLASKSAPATSEAPPPILPAARRFLNAFGTDEHFALVHFRAKNLDEASYFLARPDLEIAIAGGDAEALQKTVDRSAAGISVLSSYLDDELNNFKAEQVILAIHACAPYLFIERQEGLSYTNKVRIKEKLYDQLINNDTHLSLNLARIGSAMITTIDYFDKDPKIIQSLLEFSGDSNKYSGLTPGYDKWTLAEEEALKFLQYEPVKSFLQQPDNPRFRFNFSIPDWVKFSETTLNPDIYWLRDCIETTNADNLKEEIIEFYLNVASSQNLSSVSAALQLNLVSSDFEDNWILAITNLLAPLIEKKHENYAELTIKSIVDIKSVKEETALKLINSLKKHARNLELPRNHYQNAHQQSKTGLQWELLKAWAAAKDLRNSTHTEPDFAARQSSMLALIQLNPAEVADFMTKVGLGAILQLSSFNSIKPLLDALKKALDDHERDTISQSSDIDEGG